MDSDSYAKLRQEQLPWADKYKPMVVEELFLDDVLKKRIVGFAETHSIPNLILTGPTGVGKTAITKCLAKAFYGKYTQTGVLEINASDGGVKILHEEIVTFCRNKMAYPTKEETNKYAPFKFVIIDASDNMDENKVQPQINTIMETYKNSVRFVFACNISTKIIESIQSRCLVLNCQSASINTICEKLKFVCEQEQLSYELLALKHIADLARGDIRCAVNMLQLIKNKKNDIKFSYVGELCDLPQQVTIKKLFACVVKKDLKSAIFIINELKQHGYSGSDITLGMIHTLKSDMCNDIPEKTKVALFKQISKSIYLISKHVDSMLQLTGCLVDMIIVV